MKNVLITGGSRGIGREMVLAFTREGYRVAFTYINSEDEAQALVNECGALAIRADSTKEEDVKLAVERTAWELGDIYCLINNAGICGFSLFSDLSLEDWNKMLAVNLTGAFLYTREAIPYMVKNKVGRIINISSMWGITGSSCEAHYSAVKAGLIGMTKALAKELGPSGITVNAIAPGLIATDMNKGLSESDVRALVEATPAMRMGKVGDVASAALFLAGDGASFITGDVLNVSGGYVI